MSLVGRGFLHLRFIAYGLVFLVAVVSGLAAGVPGMVERLGHRVESRLEERLGVDISVGGADWSLDGKVELHDIRVALPDAPVNEPPLLTVGHARIASDVSFGNRNVELSTIRVEDVHLHVERRPDGTDNVSELVASVRDLFGAGAQDGVPLQSRGVSVLRFIDRTVWPDLHVEKLSVTGQAGGIEMPASIGLPERVTLSSGRVAVTNESIVKEAPIIKVDVRFGSTSMDPGFGVAMASEFRPGSDGSWWESPVDISFDRPARVVVGRRVLALGGLSWRARADSPLTARNVALSVPLTELELSRDEPVAPALEVAEIRAGLGTLTLADAKHFMKGLADQRSAGLKAFFDKLGRLELIRPAIVFERRPGGHNFKDLVRASARPTGAPSPAQREESIPDKSLGILMTTARAASMRLVSKNQTSKRSDGTRFRAWLKRGVQHLDRRVVALSGAAVAATRGIPFRDLKITGGFLKWRDMPTQGAMRFRFQERLENFDLKAVRKNDLLEFKASFTIAGEPSKQVAGKAAPVNVLEGKVHQTTGDTQLRARFANLDLFPYRHAFPASVPVLKGASLSDTDLSIVWSPTTQIARIEGKLGLNNGAFHYPSLAVEPLTGIGLRLNFGAQLDRTRKTLVLRQSDLKLGRVSFRVRGDISSYDDAPKLSAAFRLERARAQDLFDAIPKELIPMLDGLKVSGTVGWHLDFSLDTADMNSLVYHSYPEINGFRVVDMGHQLNLNAVRGAFMHRIEEANGTRREMLIGPGSTHWTPLHAISEFVIKGVTTTEDGAFYRHSGFSPFAIRNSLVANLKQGRFARGASTISQQLVKNLFLSREKTIARKVQELFITSQLETALSKERIMELYLNVIEWGPGIYGVRHASRHYFGKRPAELSALESVFLVSLIPNPKKYYWQFKRGEVSDGWRRHLRWIMGVMRDRGKISEATYLQAAPYSPVFRGRQKKLMDVLDSAKTPTATAP